MGIEHLFPGLPPTPGDVADGIGDFVDGVGGFLGGSGPSDESIAIGRLVKTVLGGPGAASLYRAHESTQRQVQLQSELAGQAHELVARLETAWTGSSADGPRQVIRAFADVADESSTVLAANARNLQRQVDGFERMKNSLEPMPDPPPEQEALDPDFSGSAKKRIRRYQQQAARNLERYRGYVDETRENVGSIGHSYGDLADQRGGRSGGGYGTSRPGWGSGSGGYGSGSGGYGSGSGGYGSGGWPGGSGYGGSGSSGGYDGAGYQPGGYRGPGYSGGSSGGYEGGTTAAAFGPGTAGGAGAGGFGPGSGGGLPGGGPSGAGGIPGAGLDGGAAAQSGGQTGAARPGGPGSGAGAAGAGRGGLGARGGGMPMGAPAGAGRGQGGEDEEYQRKGWLQENDPEGLFGTDELTPPPVIGDEDYE